MREILNSSVFGNIEVEAQKKSDKTLTSVGTDSDFAKVLTDI